MKQKQRRKGKITDEIETRGGKVRRGLHPRSQGKKRDIRARGGTMRAHTNWVTAATTRPTPIDHTDRTYDVPRLEEMEKRRKGKESQGERN